MLVEEVLSVKNIGPEVETPTGAPAPEHPGSEPVLADKEVVIRKKE